MSAIPSALSEQDLQDLKDIASRLPTGHPSQGKINLLLNSQPTQFEKERPGPQHVAQPDEGFLSNAWKATKGLVGGLMNMPNPTNPASASVAGHAIGNQIASEDQQRQQEHRSTPYRATAAIGTAIGVPARQMEEAADVGDTAGVLGAAAPITAATVAPLAAEGASRVAGAARKSIGRAIRDPLTGDLKSPYKLAVDKVLPDPDITARAQAQAVPENEARNTQVVKANADAVAEETARHEDFAKQQSEIEKNRQQELADSERLKLQHGESLMKRGAEQAKLDTAAAKETLGPKIIQPGVNEPRMTGNEGRAATWRGERVRELAGGGNREAIGQLILRGEELPENARYVMGDPDFERAVYNPREVTRFSPEGEPIRNVENPTERAPRERIAVPPAEPAAREVTNAKTGEVTRPNERRTGPAYEREIFNKMLTNPEGEQLGKSIASAREGANGKGITEGAARNYMMKQPGMWEKFTAADEAGRRKMLIEARNEILKAKK